jgi:circadian clock protein KaiC
MDLKSHLDAGTLLLEHIDPAALSPGEFSAVVRSAVEDAKARIVVIDSLNAYMNSMPEEQFMLLHMHELLTYLNQQGVVTILILAQNGLVGQIASPLDLTYLSDTVLLLRFFEASGRIRRAVSVIKKRTGFHENSIRELSIDGGGLRVGEPLEQFQGVLTGVPRFDGPDISLLKGRPDDAR